uniref:ABC transporter substrate-binding protein n=1 Tax=Thermogemmatispora argillosa TaxID=2045280 RepID=A0A455T7U3_9CHLR|nr:ABC transporter substrate-binding protein [Thermogemmatispora argillosa]
MMSQIDLPQQKRSRHLQHSLTIALCLLALMLTLTSCQIGNRQSRLVKAPASKQVYREPQIGLSDYTTLDPALVTDPSAIRAVELVFTGLVQLDDQLQVRPQLASSWTVSSDGLSWTFHLKPNLKFSDGTPLTAQDVAYSLDRALQPSTRSTTAPLYLALLRDADKLLAGTISTLINDSILVQDQETVVLITRQKAPYFLSMLTNPCSFVVERRLIEKYHGNISDHLTEGGGAGPFKVARYVHGQEIDFVPNAYYYGAKPQLGRIVFSFYRQASDAYQAYQSGQVDLTSVPLASYASDKKRADFHQVPQLWINYYTMNYLVKPFDNIHIRQAFALAINKVTIAEQVWKGTVLPTNHIVPQGMPGYNTKLTGPDGTQNLTGNPAKARQLLAQGLQEEHLSSLPPIKLTYATGLSTLDQEAKALIEMWRQNLGATVTPDPVDYNTLLSRVTAATNNPNGLQMWGLAWVAEYPDPQDWLSAQFGQGVPNNNMNYGQNVSNDAAMQQLVQKKLQEADSTLDTATRLRLYQEAEQQLVNDVAWLPLEQVNAVFLRNPLVVGFKDNGMNLVPPDDWANIYVVESQS